MRLSGYAVQTEGSGGGVEVIPVEVPGSTHIIEGANTHVRETVDKIRDVLDQIGDTLGLPDGAKALLPWLLAAVVVYGLYKVFTGRKKKSRGAK